VHRTHTRLLEHSYRRCTACRYPYIRLDVQKLQELRFGADLPNGVDEHGKKVLLEVGFEASLQSCVRLYEII
jgi:hypothetical protein